MDGNGRDQGEQQPDGSGQEEPTPHGGMTQPLLGSGQGGFVPWSSGDPAAPATRDERELAQMLERERLDDAARARALLPDAQPAPWGAPTWSAPSPPSALTPSTGAVTPPARRSAPAYSPSERLRARREVPVARQSLSHDGTPAALPLSFGEGGGARGGGPRQRFSGSGLVPQRRARRQERHARRSTLAISVLTVVLLLGSALLLFNPFQQRPSFGFAVGQRYQNVSSSQTLFLHGSAPTPTPPGGPTPTPPPSSASPTPQPTAKPQPTATPLPTPTPTLPPPGNAVVTFTAPTKSYTSPGSMTACGSGCTFGLANGSNTTSASKSVNATGSQTIYYWWHGTMHVHYRAARHCFSNGTCNSSAPFWPGGSVTFTDPIFQNGSCTLTVPRATDSDEGLCWYQAHTVGYNQYPTNNVSCDGDPGGAGATASDGSGGYYVWSFCWGSDSGTGGTGTQPVVTSGDCNNAQSQAASSATNNANSQLNSWVGGRVKVTSSVSSRWTGCNPGPGTQASSTTGSASASWSAGAFDPQTAVDRAGTLMSQWLSALGTYYWTSGPSGCTSAGAVQNAVANGTDTITCAQDGTATYDWRAASTQQTYAAKLAGLTYSQALAFCNNASQSPGVVSGTCTIKLGAGNPNQMPTAASQITIVAK